MSDACDLVEFQQFRKIKRVKQNKMLLYLRAKVTSWVAAGVGTHYTVQTTTVQTIMPCTKTLLALCLGVPVCYGFILSMAAPALQGSCRQGGSRKAQGCRLGPGESTALQTGWESTSQARPWRNRRRWRADPSLGDNSAHRRFPSYGPS